MYYNSYPHTQPTNPAVMGEWDPYFKERHLARFNNNAPRPPQGYPQPYAGGFDGQPQYNEAFGPLPGSNPFQALDEWASMNLGAHAVRGDGVYLNRNNQPMIDSYGRPLTRQTVDAMRGAQFRQQNPAMFGQPQGFPQQGRFPQPGFPPQAQFGNPGLQNAGINPNINGMMANGFIQPQQPAWQQRPQPKLVGGGPTYQSNRARPQTAPNQVQQNQMQQPHVQGVNQPKQPQAQVQPQQDINPNNPFWKAHQNAQIAAAKRQAQSQQVQQQQTQPRRSVYNEETGLYNDFFFEDQYAKESRKPSSVQTKPEPTPAELDEKQMLEKGWVDAPNEIRFQSMTEGKFKLEVKKDKENAGLVAKDKRKAPQLLWTTVGRKVVDLMRVVPAEKKDWVKSDVQPELIDFDSRLFNEYYGRLPSGEIIQYFSYKSKQEAMMELTEKYGKDGVPARDKKLIEELPDGEVIVVDGCPVYVNYEGRISLTLEDEDMPPSEKEIHEKRDERLLRIAQASQGHDMSNIIIGDVSSLAQKNTVALFGMKQKDIDALVQRFNAAGSYSQVIHLIKDLNQDDKTRPVAEYLNNCFTMEFNELFNYALNEPGASIDSFVEDFPELYYAMAQTDNLKHGPTYFQSVERAMVTKYLSAMSTNAFSLEATKLREYVGMEGADVDENDEIVKTRTIISKVPEGMIRFVCLTNLLVINQKPSDMGIRPIRVPGKHYVLFDKPVAGDLYYLVSRTMGEAATGIGNELYVSFADASLYQVIRGGKNKDAFLLIRRK